MGRKVGGFEIYFSFGLVWSGLVSSDLVLSGLVLSGLVWLV